MSADKAEGRRPQGRAGRAGGRRWLWVVAPLAAFLVLVALILVTGRPSADSLMKSAASSFADVRRGTFKFAVTVTPQGGSSEASSIVLSGPFEMVPGKPMPRALITYSVSSGGRSQDVTLLTTGDKAYSLIKGQAYALPGEATKQLKAASKNLKSDDQAGSLSGLKLNFDRWLIDPKVSAGGELDGTAVWRVTSGVNLVAALKDVARAMNALSSVTGQTVGELKESQIKQLNKQIRSARVVIDVGRYDDILRQMELTMFFKTPADAAAQSGGITGGSMTLTMAISDPNRPVNVQDPKNPLPYSALKALVEGSASQSGTVLDDGVGR